MGRGQVETMTSGILMQISGIGKCRVQFLVHLVRLYLSIRGRINFLSMERYGHYGEQTYRQHFERPMDFKTFNELLIKSKPPTPPAHSLFASLGFQFCGSSSSKRLTGCRYKRLRTSQSQVSGLMPCCLQAEKKG